jgi:hypothetical protein
LEQWEVVMSRLILKIRRGSKVIGSWSLGDEPLEMTIEDSSTGEILGSFLAKGQPKGVDEVPLERTGRLVGDDLTMPLPEDTSSLDLPMAELTSQSVSLPMPLSSDDPNHTRQFIADALQQRQDGLDLFTRSDDLSLPEADLGPGFVHGTGSWADELQVHKDPSLSGVFKAEISPAEVWLRKAREWHARGRLPAGSRLDAGGGWIGLDTEGRLIVNPGPRLVGTVTRLDGSSYELESGGEPRLLSLGASVILREGDHGIYVRSMVPEHGRLDQPTEESTR